MSFTTKSKLLIQPGVGAAPLVDAIERAEESVHIVIFRFDRREIEAALRRAVKRGVFVHAMVAHTMAGQGGDATLRKLEQRLLSDGITVTRTATDLIRYHSKLLIIDGKTLFVLTFNYTYLDIDRSRSYGIETTNPEWIEEAAKLFAADATRQLYAPAVDSFLVSPGNSRHRLMGLLAAAENQLLIYDGKLSDPDAMRLLAGKVRAGVDVRVIGGCGKRALGVQTARPHIRLHAQAIIRDGKELFLGSQSLRTYDLDLRREVGVIIDDPGIVGKLVEMFEADWARASGCHVPVQSQEAMEIAEELMNPADFTPNGHAPVFSMQLVKSVVKEAIKDAILDTLPETSEVVPIKDAIKDAAKEALVELST